MLEIKNITKTFNPGTITIDGVDITSMPEYKRAKFLGRVFQDPMMGTAASMQIDENFALAHRRARPENGGKGSGDHRPQRARKRKSSPSTTFSNCSSRRAARNSPATAQCFPEKYHKAKINPSKPPVTKKIDGRLLIGFAGST